MTVKTTLNSSLTNEVSLSTKFRKGQDPFVTFDSETEKYILVQSRNNDTEISIVSSKTVEGLFSGPFKKILLPERPYNKLIWAPEIHKLNGKWFMYYTACKDDNRSHRTFVAEANDSQGPYKVIGMVLDTKNNNWSIDMTILEYNKKLYGIYSGWEVLDSDLDKYKEEDLVQYLFIAEMENPWIIKQGTSTKLSVPHYPWERSVRAINEGPQVILTPKCKPAIVYSANASWDVKYCQGLLVLQGENPLDSNDWRKSPNYLFERTNIGHLSFVKNERLDAYDTFYHTKTSKNQGWSDRVIKHGLVYWQNETLVMKSNSISN